MDRQAISPNSALTFILGDLDHLTRVARSRSRWRNSASSFVGGTPGAPPAAITRQVDQGFWNVLVSVSVSATTGLSPGSPVVTLRPSLQLRVDTTAVAESTAFVSSTAPLPPNWNFTQTVWLGVSGALPIQGQVHLAPNNTTSGGTVAVSWRVNGVVFGA